MGAAAAQQLGLEPEVEQAALVRDALVVHEVEFADAEWSGDFVLDHPHPGTVAGDLGAALDLTDPADVKAHGRVELERAAARGRLRIAKHNADLFAQLVNEHDDAAGAADAAGELAQRLGHQTGLQTDVGVAHVPFDFGARHERRDGVDDDDIDGVATHQNFGDFEGLFADAGLGNQEVVDVDATLHGIGRIKGVLGVDQRRRAAGLLGLGDDVLREGGLAGSFGAKHLNYSTARQAAYPKRQVEGDGSGGHHADLEQIVAGHAKNRAFAKLLLDLGDRGI